MENYICINGKKAELTEEQMKALGIELPKVNPFDRVDYNQDYYFINGCGSVENDRDSNHTVDGARFNAANYCTDKEIMQQRALHETLNRLLWRYSMTHDGDKIDWNNTHQLKYVIVFTHYNSGPIFEVEQFTVTHSIGSIYFTTKETALNAIEEIFKPFIAEHPDFKF